MAGTNAESQMLLIADIATPGEMAPSVAELLDVDREFRASQKQQLAISRGSRQYRALFSPTSLARRMGMSADWVIIEQEVAGPNPKWTVVTEWRGLMKGKRVVRGREAECFDFYAVSRTRRPRPARIIVAG